MIVSYDVLKNLYEISEDRVRDTANMIGGVNALTELLDRADEFRAANCIPIFLMNDEQTMMIVTCEETRYDWKLH